MACLFGGHSWQNHFPGVKCGVCGKQMYSTTQKEIHPGRKCAQCGQSSGTLVRRNAGKWDGLRYCVRCGKYFCGSCQIDNYNEACPICELNLINKG
jgi:hypothetical protein